MKKLCRRRRTSIKDKQGRPAMQGSGDSLHFETGKPWPKHTRPHPLAEDYPE